MVKETQSARWHFFMPLVFISLYGSGFVGAKLGLPYAQPLTFLVLRFACTALLLLLMVFLWHSPWPRKLNELAHIMVAGLLMLGVFSAGVFVAINCGISPSISALIIALQPILVGLGAGPILGEKIRVQQWAGLLLGLLGVFLVVSHKLTFSHMDMVGLAMNFLGLLGLTAGNLYQKRFCADMNIFSGGLIQSLTAGVAVFIAALIFESMQIVWNGQFIFALAWMSIVVSFGALSVLYLLIRHGEATRVASLFYLVPVSTSLFAYFVYNETIDKFTIGGIIIIALGIMLVQKRALFKKSRLVEEL
ncbi:MAG: DMT family transporter [Tatlockia sp.]|nr:DMT family transporter [Tatlockia sp.]